MSTAAGSSSIVVGVTGGIAAFKAVETIRLLSEAGYNVEVIATKSALQFVGEATMAALSGNEVHTDAWAEVHNVPHVNLARNASAIVVVPATADFMARMTHGRADDILTATILTATCPIILAPAMHTEMWENSATVENVATLRKRGVVVLEPGVGRLTGVDTGKGRLSEPSEIALAVNHALSRDGDFADLAGKHIVVTAGGTREAIDPVRFITNRSSGKQGFAIATVAAVRGARVTLINANSTLAVPAGVDVVNVESASELRRAVLQHIAKADALVMTAAVADYRPSEVAKTKIKKSIKNLEQIELTENPDILREVVELKKPNFTVIGFAAETGDDKQSALDYGLTKLAAKGVDALVVNQVGKDVGFESDQNAVTIVSPYFDAITVEITTKVKIAETVCNVVKSLSLLTNK
ncbi:MAG: bifunctional phosphopantothenoylcysteine decarboxylase/phosphopantothenate--cysteine ligase CoaBC [Actinobacteria bacterium]|nr:bifunctional phosphopantothenoylcysteine decarboxylase/phosphopantothenate--cysteine ligase CoaBC [Actinomycetota bacterium]